MSAPTGTLRPLSCWKAVLRQSRRPHMQTRSVSAGTLRYRRPPPVLPPPSQLPPGMTYSEFKDIPTLPHKIKVHPPPPTATKVCKEPLRTFAQQQIAVLDPTSSRTRLFSKTNFNAAHVGDVMLVRFRSGDPFSGVCINIRRRGVDSAVLLRNQITRIGTEVWVKIYSPLVVGMEIVERKAKRARRARLYYMRKPKHDRGPLANLVENYIKTKKALGRVIVGGGKIPKMKKTKKQDT